MQILVLVQVASILSVQSGGGGWYLSKNKDRYSDRYWASSVRWCSVLDVASHAIVLLSVSTERCGRGSAG